MQMKPATANRASSSRRWDRSAGGGGGSRVIMADELRSFNQTRKPGPGVPRSTVTTAQSGILETGRRLDEGVLVFSTEPTLCRERSPDGYHRRTGAGPRVIRP